MYTDENYVSCCRERMPALLYNCVSRELVPHFVSCRFVSLTNHTSVGVVRDAIRLRTKRWDQLTKVEAHKLAQKTRSPRTPRLARTGSSSASSPSVL